MTMTVSAIVAGARPDFVAMTTVVGSNNAAARTGGRQREEYT